MNPKKKEVAPQQMDLLDQDTRDTEQVVNDLIIKRDTIDRCLKLADEIMALMNTDAIRLLEDAREASKTGDPKEVLLAETKRNNHLSLDGHKKLSALFNKALREVNEHALVMLRDSLLAMDEVTIFDKPGPNTPMSF